MIGDEKIRELVSIVNHETNDSHSVKRVEMLMYLIDREYYEDNNNHKATNISWIRTDKPETERIRKVINKNNSNKNNSDDGLYMYFEDDEQFIKNVINKYNDYSIDELKEECKDEYFNNAGRNEVISIC